MPIAEPLVTQSIAESMLKEFEIQAPITRRFLERLPADEPPLFLQEAQKVA
jgi:hypothetical protein